jgi:hypothetical protein
VLFFIIMSWIIHVTLCISNIHINIFLSISIENGQTTAIAVTTKYTRDFNKNPSSSGLEPNTILISSQGHAHDNQI